MFSVPAVHSAFHDALIQDEDVDVKNYVIAYQELCKFCSQLGALFGFVVKDLQDKIDRLNYLIAYDEQHFSTVQNMILYEKSNDMVKGNSGCVTLLRLHRGLEFIILFMSKLLHLKPNESTKHSAIESYNQTLAKHHTWLIRHGARLAMNFLPCQENLYCQTIGDESVEESLNTMPDMISKATTVHNRINTLFSDYEILNIP